MGIFSSIPPCQNQTGLYNFEAIRVVKIQTQVQNKACGKPNKICLKNSDHG